MSSSCRTALLGVVVFALATPCLAQRASRGAASDFDARTLTAPPRSWPTNGGNVYNQRYSPLAQINAGNVGRLRGVWRARLHGSGAAPQYSGEAQPLVYAGVAYVSTGADDVFALSIDSGELLWQYEAHLDPNLTSVCCGWTNRGVALGDGKVFVGQLDGKLVALDRLTGKIIWATQAERWQDNFSITAAPLFLDGKVIVGFAGADRGTRGRVKAYDARNGRLLWTFYTIPGPGEPGHDSWPQDNDAWKYGGGSIWQTPAADPELGLVYFSTGNAGPDYNGAYRAGDNLYTASIVAIDAATGKYRWHFQQVHHDLWDYDAVNPVVLMDLTIDGRTRKALVEVGKTGFAYILDRATGEPIVGIDERPVPQEPRQATAATQPFPRGEAVVPQIIEIAPEGFALSNAGRIFTPFVGEDPTIVKPGIWGGASWPPSAFDPTAQTLFVCASSVVGAYTGGGEPSFVAPGQGERYLGGRTAGTRLPRSGILAAIDARTNKLVWRYRWPEQCYSGVLATAGGLLFVGRSDGRLTAVAAGSGKQLWEFQTGAGMNAAVSTFEHRGHQYVIAYSAGNALIGSARGDSVWLFGLEGALGAAEPGAPAPRTTAVPEPIAGAAATVAAATAPDLDNGQRLYARTCVICHGEDGKGGHGGGAPLDGVRDVALAIEVVGGGRNNMPPFSTALTPAQIRDVSVYVVTALSQAGR